MNFSIRCLAVLIILLVAGFIAGPNRAGRIALGEEKPTEPPSKKQTKQEKKDAKEKEKAAEKAKKLQAELLAKEQEAKELAARVQQAKQQQQEWAKKLKVPVETKSKSGIELVLIPPSDKAVPEPYWIGKYEVTQTEWKIVKWNRHDPAFAATPSRYQGDDEAVRGLDTSQFPLEFVSWNQCIAFCNCLSEQEGLEPYYGAIPRADGIPNGDFRSGVSRRTTEIKILGGQGYHLPTSVQWEHACRAGTTTPYFFGSTAEKINEYAWYQANSEKRPHPVGQKKPNAFGLFDMAGNVGEWTEETFPKLVEEDGRSVTRMFIASRGGAHLFPSSKCASAATFDLSEHSSSWAVGFRLVRAATPREQSDSAVRENVFYKIQFVPGKKVLGIIGAKDDDARVILAPNNDLQGQQWKFVKAGDYYKIVNRKSGKALNVANASGEENAAIIQWDAADDGENQQWSLVKQGEHFVIQARHSGMVLDVADDSKNRKATVVQSNLREGRNQRIELVPVNE